MTFLAPHLRAMRQAAFRMSSIPVAVALVVVLVGGVLVDGQNDRMNEQHLRSDTLARINVIRMKLEETVRSDVQLAGGLASAIATEPNIDASQFTALASRIVTEGASLRELTVAPDLVVSMAYPPAEKATSVGVDLRGNPDFKAAVMRARDQEKVVLTGPLALPGGGELLIARLPVFTADPNGGRRFWGVVSASLDAERLYAASGLLTRSLPLDVTIVGRDGRGVLGQPFFGREDIRRENPVGVNVALPSGSWQILAVPEGGWNKTPDNALLVRTLIVLAGIAILAPVLVASRLVEERSRHVTAMRNGERELARLSRRLGVALESSKIGVWECDIASGELVWDERMNEIYGFPPAGERTYLDWHRALHPEDVARAEQEFRRAIQSTGQYSSEFRVVLPSGEVRHVRAIGKLHEETGAPAHIIGVNWDVSADAALNNDLKQAKLVSEARSREIEAAKNRIEHNALHDPLTGLPNRRFLDDVLNNRSPRRDGLGGRFAILHVDLDRFKQINDTLGHAAGDAMLIHAAEVLRAATRPEDFVARIGGDEFVIVCAFETGAEQLSALAERIVEAMRQPVLFEGHQCRFGVSIGIAVGDSGEAGAKQIMANADLALYRAKNLGRNRFEFFTETMGSGLVRGRRMADEILSGLARDEFVAFYQPQFDARSLDLVGVEAFVRWRHPTEGVLAPEQFLDDAEDVDALLSVDRAVLARLVADLRVWDEAGVRVPRASIALSPRRLADEDLASELRRLRLEPRRISFEVAEPAPLGSSDAVAARNIRRIRAMGHGLDIGAFGTGRASLAGLLQLKPRRLKLDRELVSPLVSAVAQQPLVRSLIGIGTSLGIEVAAGGVDTMEHARILRDLGCDVVQGDAFAPPMPVEDLAALLRTRRWRAA